MKRAYNTYNILTKNTLELYYISKLDNKIIPDKNFKALPEINWKH